MRVTLLACCIFASGGMRPVSHDPAHTLYLITDKHPGRSAAYALNKLKARLREKHIACKEISTPEQAAGPHILVCGLATGNGLAAQMIRSQHHLIYAVPEALTVWRTRWHEKPVVVVNGYDDKGLMYALLETAEQITWSGAGAPLQEVKEISERPAIRDRAVSIYTMNRAYWESRFYDTTYWSHYLDMMAQNRFNSLVVIFGYENGGFLAPCYPYFFNVDGFPGVKMTGLGAEQQKRNLEAINKLIDMAHERGIRFTAGIWDHIYRGGVQGGGIPGNEKAPDHPIPGLVWGVDADNLTAYTKAALTAFIHKIPVDALQFRMHGESGLKKGEEEAFWTDVFKMIKAVKPALQVDMRAKELPPAVIQSAIRTGIRFRIDTKYWMEQMGLPYHPTRINPDKSYIRHSYGDLLRYPPQYKMCWRLWNGGTSRVLLWGDPEYVKRFTGSVHLYNGDGFDVNEPLATKMEAQPHDAKPFDLQPPQHRYYDYEFERYWHFFQVFGRLGYNPDADPAIWDHAFAARFGGTAGPLVEKALHRASTILPRIIACSYPYSKFPTTRGWAEKQSLGDLPSFSKAEGSDLCQFANFDEEAKLLLEGGETAKIRPAASSQWFSETAAAVDGLVRQVRQQSGISNKELASTLADLGILSGLARYHASRIPAAVNYCLYRYTKDPAALDAAITYERQAVKAWQGIVEAAGDFYTDNLMMGLPQADLSGHWKDELVKLQSGLQQLEQARKNADTAQLIRKSPVYTIKPSPAFEQLFRVTDTTPGNAPAGRPVTIRLQASAAAGIKWVRLRYRAVNQQLEYETLPMAAGSNGEFTATIPAGKIDPTWDLMYYIEIMDNNGNGRIYPDVNKETPYRIINLKRNGHS